MRFLCISESFELMCRRYLGHFRKLSLLTNFFLYHFVKNFQNPSSTVASAAAASAFFNIFTYTLEWSLRDQVILDFKLEWKFLKAYSEFSTESEPPLRHHHRRRCQQLAADLAAAAVGAGKATAAKAATATEQCNGGGIGIRYTHGILFLSLKTTLTTTTTTTM